MTADLQMCPNFPHGPRDCGGVARQAGSDYTCTFCFEQRRSNAAIVPLQDAALPSVSLVTALAEAGDLSVDEYREIYDRVAAGRSLRNVELALRSGVTFGWWAKYAAGEKALDRERKNELRRWAGLPDLPPSVVEAVAAGAHPDVAVYQVGAQVASRVILVGADVVSVNLRINGNVGVVGAGPALESQEAACTGRYSPQAGEAIHRTRVHYLRPCLSRDPVARVRQLEELLAAARREVGDEYEHLGL